MGRVDSGDKIENKCNFERCIWQRKQKSVGVCTYKRQGKGFVCIVEKNDPGLLEKWKREGVEW